jgi:nucleotide-binding universal stress UspA family protein
MYPSRQIVRQAIIDDFGTIVMGRRSKEISKGVFGSVTEKVLAMSVNTAIWIVG